jgi:hypothetical protein
MLRDLVRSCCLIWGGKGGVEEDAGGVAVEVAEGMVVSVGAGGIIVVVARTDQRRVRGRGREGNDDMGGGAMDLMMAPHVLRAESCELVVTVDYVILPGVTLRTNDSATCRSLRRGTGRRGTTPGADCCMVYGTK